MHFINRFDCIIIKIKRLNELKFFPKAQGNVFQITAQVINSKKTWLKKKKTHHLSFTTGKTNIFGTLTTS